MNIGLTCVEFLPFHLQLAETVIKGLKPFNTYDPKETCQLIYTANQFN